MRLSDRPGNVFVASNGGRVPRGRSFVTVSWAGPRKLVVEFERGTAVYRLERRVAGVEVVYVARDADGHAAAPQDAPQPRRAK